MRFLFTRDGKFKEVGVAEPKDSHRADVAQCLRDHPWTLSIDPTGSLAGTQLELTLP